MSSGRSCSHCGCTEIEEDAARGDAVCTSCGAVLEENVIVAELQFEATGAGGHVLIGQNISADDPQKVRIAGLQGFSTRESREVTLQNGRRRIQEVASQLRLNQHCVDVAFNFFKMAVSYGITRGRPSTHTVAGVLYITCRLEGTPHLLLDFSDVLMVNVFELGRVFSFLSQKLRIQLPPTDPCIYVMRFANSLKFGEKEHEVAMLALRLVQRMKRDWMAIGRRPTGICGAALLLAARFHNFNRSIYDIVRVVQIGEGAIRKRLHEFSLTASSSLTLDEFQSVELEETADPPAFIESRRKARMQQVEEEATKLDSMKPRLLATEKAVQNALEQALDRRTKRYRKLSSQASECGTPRSRSRLSSVSSSILMDIDADDLEADFQEDCELFLKDELLQKALVEEEESRARLTCGPFGDESAVQPEETIGQKLRPYGPTLESLGLSQEQASDASAPQDQAELTPSVTKMDPAYGHEKPSTSGDTASANLSATDDLNDIDDAEIDSYLLSPGEVQMKAKIWNALNGSYLEEMEERRKRKAEEEAQKLAERGTKRKRVRKRKAQIQASTASEAIEKIVVQQKLSKKINYEVLKSLSTPSEDKFSQPIKHQKLESIKEISEDAAVVTEADLPTSGPPLVGEPPDAGLGSEEDTDGEGGGPQSALELLREHQSQLYGPGQSEEPDGYSLYHA